jgi:hypothetical protein
MRMPRVISGAAWTVSTRPWRKPMKKFILHELVGIDTSMGIFIYLCSSYFFLEKQSISILLIAIFFARFPDFGFPLYLLLRQRLDLQTHRTLTHYPIIAVPLAGLLGYLLGYFFFPGEIKLLTMIASIGCSAHFVHDSWDEFGIPWLWPFKSIRYRVCGNRIEKITRQEQEDILFRIREKQQRDSCLSNELVIHTEAISGTALVFFCCMLALLLLGLL